MNARPGKVAAEDLELVVNSLKEHLDNESWLVAALQVTPGNFYGFSKTTFIVTV